MVQKKILCVQQIELSRSSCANELSESLCIKYKLSTLYGMLKLLHLQYYVLHKVFSIQ